MSNNQKKTINFKAYRKVSSDETDMYMNMEENNEKNCAIVYASAIVMAYHSYNDRIVMSMKTQFKISSSKDEFYQDGEEVFTLRKCVNSN